MALSTETKVGLFTLSGLAVFAVGILILGDIQFRGTVPLHIYFTNADGLPENGSVKVAGVEVGKIAEIGLDGPRARVVVQVRNDLDIHQGAKAHVASTGLIGSKYLEMTLGDPAAPRLQPGDTLEGIPSFSFDEAMRKLGEFLQDDPRNGAMTDNLRVTLANFRTVSQALADSLGQQRAEMTEIVRNIRDASAHAKQVAAGLQDITDSRKEDVKVALEKFRSISERLDKILANVEDGQGMLAKLLNDPEMAKQMESTMTNVNKASTDMKGFMGRIADIDIYWDYRQRYDMEYSRAHADVGLYMSPRPGKFYYVGGNNLGAREDRTVDGNDMERRNTVTALLGFDFGPWTLSGGVIRSAGGAGVKFRPLPESTGWNRRVELEGEFYDYGRDEVIQGVTLDKPVFNVGARVKAIDPWLWVGAQLEDAAVQKNFTVNANLNFRDEDLAFLLGLIGLAR